MKKKPTTSATKAPELPEKARKGHGGGAALKAASSEKTVRRGIQSIETGFTILDALRSASGPVPLGKLAELTGLTTANTHYYLVSFQRVGIVQQDADTGHYGLGPYALKLGIAALEQFDVYKLARPSMLDISTQTGHTVFLGVWGNKGPTIVYRVEGSKSLPLLELRVGSVLPLLSSALGRNFLAHLPAAETSGMLEHELKLQSSGYTVPHADIPRTAAAVDEMKSIIRDQGYSRCQNTLLPNFTSLSAPIFDLSAGIVAALTIMGPAHMLTEENEADAVRLLKRHTAEISQTAGMYG